MIQFKYLLVMGVFIPSLLSGQTTESTAISNAIKSGNATELATYLSSSVDLTLLSVEDVYSKEQAEVILTRFFSENSPASFAIKHEGKSKMDDHFYIGDLITSNGTYRLTFFLKNESSKYRIRQLRVEN